MRASDWESSSSKLPEPSREPSSTKRISADLPSLSNMSFKVRKTCGSASTSLYTGMTIEMSMQREVQMLVATELTTKCWITIARRPLGMPGVRLFEQLQVLLHVEGPFEQGFRVPFAA